MSYTNGKIKGPIDIYPNGGDIGQAIGVSSCDLEVLCTSDNNNPWNLYKPIRHASVDFVTLAQRIEKFHSLTPKDLASIRSTATFATVPTPEKWGWVKPNGPYRQLDYGHIETDLSKLRTDYGYDSGAQAPLIMDTDVTVSISTDPAGGDVLCPIFKYNEQSANGYGSANIALYLRDLIFRRYGNRDNVSAWKLPSNYDDIFNAAGALSTGVWRFAIALAVLTSANGPYKWVLVSSPDPLSLPFSSNNSAVFMSHVIRPSYNQVVANAIKYAVRNYGQTQITCIPFLACNLKYTESRGWYFSGGSYERAITFPRGDTFRLTPTGFATTLAVVYAGFRVAWTNTNDASQNISGLTWYTGQLQAVGGQAYMFITLPRPTGFNYCIMELTFTVNTHFGVTSNVVAGMLINSGGTAGKLFTNDGAAIDSISGEWINSAHTYKVRQMGPNLRTLMAQSPDSVFPLTDTEGFDMYFDNTQMASRQHKMDAGTGIALQS